MENISWKARRAIKEQGQNKDNFLLSLQLQSCGWISKMSIYSLKDRIIYFEKRDYANIRGVKLKQL